MRLPKNLWFYVRGTKAWIGRDLRDRSRRWLNKNLGLIVAEPAFLALPAAEVAELVESDDLEACEEEVFKLVMNWVKEDEEARTPELDRLLPLVRFPLMKEGARAIMAEPLVAQHPLAAQLVSETRPQLDTPTQAEGCPRLRPRVIPLFRSAPHSPVWSSAAADRLRFLAGPRDRDQRAASTV